MQRSRRTFKSELIAVGGIPGVLWDQPADYEGHQPGAPLFEPIHRWDSTADAVRRSNPLDDDRLYPKGPSDQETPPDRPIPGTGHVFTESLDQIYRSGQKSDEALAAAVHRATGVDLDELLREAAGQGPSTARRLADLTADLGMEAFGCYLPWHAFVKSSTTPWGQSAVTFDKTVK